MGSSSSSGNPHYRALLQLLRTADSLWNSSRLFFGRWGLSPSQFNVLNVLADRPAGVSQIEMGRLLIMHRSNVTGLVDRLEQRGLVERRNVDGDRRAYRLVLSPAGRKLVREILPEYHRVAREVWNGFPATSAEQLAADLKRLGANAENITATKKLS